MKPTYIIFFLLLLFASACTRKHTVESWTGTVEGTQTRVNALLGGSIVKLLVDEGSAVSKGDTLAILDTRELSYQLEQLKAGKEELTAQESIIHTQIAQAEKDLQYQQTRQSRSQNLYQGDAIARQNLEDVELVGTKAESQLTAARQNLAVISAKRKQLNAQEKTLLKKVNDGMIISPASGIVSSLYYDEGEVIPPLGQLLELIDNQQVEITIYVNESMLSRIEVGMPAQINTNGSKNKLPAVVINISSQAEFTPKTVLTTSNRSVMVYAVRLKAENPNGILKDGMPVDVSFQ